MNCKPGDLARIIHPDAYGKFVDVIEAAPIGDHTLPDGQLACTYWPGRWVCRLHGAPLDAPMLSGPNKTRKTHYGVIADALLRPIRDPGDDAKDETLSWKPLPLPEIIPAMLDREVEHE